MSKTIFGLVVALVTGAGPVMAQPAPADPGNTPFAPFPKTAPTAPTPAATGPTALASAEPPSSPGPVPAEVPASPLGATPVPSVPVVPEHHWSEWTGLVPPPVNGCKQCAVGGRVWVDTEYLLWWEKKAPGPPPLASAGPGGLPIPGIIGQPSTTVLAGGSDLGFGNFSGGQLTVGAWLDHYGAIGVEGRGLLLERRGVQTDIASDAGGRPLLGVPFLNALTGQEDFAEVSSPNTLVGRVDFASSTRLWGAESNFLWNVWRDQCLAVELLGGFRYLDLQDVLGLDTTSAPLPGSQGLFGTVPLPPPAIVLTSDRFATRNQFYGGQGGIRMEFRNGNFFTKVAANLAVGTTHQVVDVNGQTALFVGPVGPTGVIPGGIFTQPTNIGRFTQNSVSVVPDAEVRLGYRFTSCLSVFVGYSFLYWTNVVRPGDQVDRHVNPTLVPSFAEFGHLVGPPQPASLFRTTDFWAQGVNFGLELRY